MLIKAIRLLVLFRNYSFKEIREILLTYEATKYENDVLRTHVIPVYEGVIDRIQKLLDTRTRQA